MGGFLKFLGFALPLHIAMDGADPKAPPRDRLPVSGRCYLCKRERAVCYVLGDGRLVCQLDIEGTLKSRRVQMVQAHRRTIEPPAEAVVAGSDDEFAKRQWRWNSWLD